MQGQVNYARQAGHYEGTIRGLSRTLEWLVENPYLSHEELLKRVKDVSETMKEAIEEGTSKDFLY